MRINQTVLDLTVILVLCSVGMVEARTSLPAQALAGVVTDVRDGDTIEVGSKVIRLHGVAAPERSEPLGKEAARMLRRLVDGQEVACTPDGTRTRGRIVAVCKVEGEDVGALLIRAGLARDCPRYSKGRYATDEQAAMARGTAIQTIYELPDYCRPKP